MALPVLGDPSDGPSGADEVGHRGRAVRHTCSGFGGLDRHDGTAGLGEDSFEDRADEHLGEEVALAVPVPTPRVTDDPGPTDRSERWVVPLDSV